MGVGLLAGMAGGTLGLGGAIILVPVWLNQGIDKGIAASSSGPLIFFSAAVSFFLGLLSSTYDSFMAITFYFLLAFVGSYAVKGNFVTILFRGGDVHIREVQSEGHDLHFADNHDGFFLGNLTAVPVQQIFAGF